MVRRKISKGSIVGTRVTEVIPFTFYESGPVRGQVKYLHPTTEWIMDEFELTSKRNNFPVMNVLNEENDPFSTHVRQDYTGGRVGTRSSGNEDPLGTSILTVTLHFYLL